MLIQKIEAKVVKDSRRKNTIKIIVQTSKGDFATSAPAGKSTGKYAVRLYAKSLKGDVSFVNELDLSMVNGIDFKKFEDLEMVEGLVEKNIGGNSLFALEASLLKAIAKENGKELWEFLGGKKVRSSKMRAVGNSVGGGLHSKGMKGVKPDFQEFLFIGHGKNFSECVEINEMAYELAGKLLGSVERNDEGAWETGETNEGVLEVMKKVRRELRENGFEVDIGLDVASSSFYKTGKYCYENSGKCLGGSEQVEYLADLVEKYGLIYVEDGLDEKDFSGFSDLLKKVKGGGCLVVGDDLVVTNPNRLKKAISMRAVNAIIVKPNQIGSLLKVKKVFHLAKKKGIKTIISHRSGETMDSTIADLGVGFECDFIKTGIYGSVRRVKLDRLVEIEKKI